MKILEKNSYCTIRKSFDLSLSDEQVLSYLYLPIIKADSLSLYRNLFYYVGLNPLTGGFLSSDFLSLMGMDESTFLLSRSTLEAIGLLETYRKEERDDSNQIRVSYLYLLLPPASPKKFFNDVLLKTLLNEAVGNKRYFSLYSFFQVEESKPEEGYVSVTTPFKEVFSPKVKEGDLSLENIVAPLEDKKYKSQSNFDMKKLKSQLLENQYRISLLDPYWKDIQNTCSLYDPNVNDVVLLLMQDTDSEGNFYLDHFVSDIRNLRKFTSTNSFSDRNVDYGNSEVGKLVEKFNALTPDEYLSIIYNGRPAKFMFDEVEKLKKNLAFSNPIINVLLDYCLKRTNYEFNTTFIDKVAYTLSSLDVQDAYDAMMKLTSRDFELSQVNRRKSVRGVNKREKTENPKKEEEVSREDIADLTKDLDL